ncbi:hypothetical protein LMTR3_19055 [Bradyrhizobium sp. LMTR 3]|nr:hypothetical protein LMTR3_19055 [Bradyrhizobium sp. LMTR 3]
MCDFAYFLKFEQAVPSLIGASDIVPQLRLLKCNEITAELAGKWRFAAKPWHCFLMLMAGSRTRRIGVSIAANCHDQTPEITGPHA